MSWHRTKRTPKKGCFLFFKRTSTLFMSNKQIEILGTPFCENFVLLIKSRGISQLEEVLING